ncbi:MAG: metal ABC transporter permease, partial [Cocleimonas sp.]|nr:metal ABC transporter permease [Cocleimonas sp.]
MIIHQQGKVHGNRRDWQNLRSILPYLMDYRGRALLALAFLVLSKVANVGIPITLKAIVDYLEGHQTQVLILPVALLLAYGALRLSSSLFNELRDTIFAKVRYRAMRRLSTRVLAHLHNLSLRFHLDRKTGAISRDLERGTRSVGTIMNFMVFSIIPVMVEFSLVAVILLSQYAPVFTLITFGTIIAYMSFTFFVTEWRMEYRHEMNRLDSEANSYAIDSLINYETVKYFNNEKQELERVDAT